VIGLYLALAIGSSLTKRPWSDEGWFANPAVNLLETGSMGTTVIEPVIWKGINEHTYWVMPLHLVTQAGWYGVFGFSLFSMRLLSVVCGLIALGSWLLMMRKLSGDHNTELLALALIGVDYVFINGASFGRMDMMSSALGFAGCAAYLALRERNLNWAVLASQCLVVASGLTHFLGVLPFAGVLFLTIYFDFRRLSPRHLGLALIPYIVGGIGWGLYVLQDPASFVSQFTANAMASDRLDVLASPLQALKLEITNRYFVAFGLGPHSAGHSGPIMLKSLVLVGYAAAIAGALLVGEIRRQKGNRALLILAGLYFIILTMLDGQKLSWYLIHIVPIYAAILAVWVRWLWTQRFVPKWVTAAVVAGLVLIQLGGSLYRIKLNTYQKSYQPVAEFLRQNAFDGALMMGSAELGFELGFDRNLIDDSRLGYHTGKRPDLVVVDEIYEDAISGLRVKDPSAYQHVMAILGEYPLIYEYGHYRVYAAPHCILSYSRRLRSNCSRVRVLHFGIKSLFRRPGQTVGDEHPFARL
jgi:hypothetical protein